MRTQGFAILSVCGVLALVTVSRARGDDAPGWNPRAAAQYLDGRARDWFAFQGAHRGEGANQISCLSCHTSVPYLIGRAALHDAASETTATPHEDRLLAGTRLRVEHWKELDSPRFGLAYDFDDRKKVESRGTEAVLNALVLALDDRHRGKKAPAKSTRKAIEILWSTQLATGADRGAWDWLDFGNHPWEPGPSGEGVYFGATLAAIAIGSAPGYPAADDAQARAGLDRLRGYIRSHHAKQGVHHAMWTLWAASVVDGLLTPAEREQTVTRVLAAQRGDGGWALASIVSCKRQDGSPQDLASDGYATGLALHVLPRSGVSRANPKLARALAWLRANQQPGGDWQARSLNKKRDPKTNYGKFMSDAATALAALALTESDAANRTAALSPGAETR